MFMQRRSHFDKSEKWAYFVSCCVVGSPSFLRGTTRGLLYNRPQSAYSVGGETRSQASDVVEDWQIILGKI